MFFIVLAHFLVGFFLIEFTITSCGHTVLFTKLHENKKKKPKAWYLVMSIL